MQDMIDDGADLIFATSFGHLEFAANLAAENPDVVFVHQGGLEQEPLDNLGTYFGTVYEPVYTAGIAAGSVSESGVLGYVYAFPIPQTLANINAFTLGAQSVNPDIDDDRHLDRELVRPVAPGAGGTEPDRRGRRRADPAPGLHQDHHRDGRGGRRVLGRLPRRCVRAGARRAGSPGRSGTGARSTPTSCRRSSTASSPTSDYNGDFRVGLQTGDNPFIQSAFGPMVSDETEALIEEARAAFIDGGSPFAGPVTDQDGEVVWAEGEQPTYADVETMDFFVQGVIGSTG